MSEIKFVERRFALKSQNPEEILIIIIHDVVDTTYGLFIWPCATLLAKYVYHQRNFLSEKHLLEIGCGTALPGIVAASIGAQVTLSDSEDLPACLEHAKQSCSANGLTDVTVTGITWGVYSPSLVNLLPVDVILGSDCFYNSKDFEPVLATVAYLLKKNPGCQFWTTYQVRSASRNIEALLHKWHLHAVNIPLSELDSTVVEDCATGSLIHHDEDTFQLFILTS